MKIAIGNDHAGTEYKLAIMGMLTSKNIQVINYGSNDTDSVDYADFAHPVALEVDNDNVDYGIIICGSGIGVSMTANKHQKVRAALCWNKEIVTLCRQHNNANVLCLPARFISLPQALEMIATFLDVAFEGGRHETRIDKIPC